MTVQTEFAAETFDLTLIRVLNAPRALVFEMWSNPDHKSQWWRPKAFKLIDFADNFRPGGDWMSVMEGPSGSQYRMEGQYKEIVENEQIVFTHHWVEDGVRGPQTLITITFSDVPEGTRLTFLQSLIASADARDEQHGGWNEFLDMLTSELTANS